LTTVNIRFNARNQFLPYINRTERWAAVVAHRRAGKTVACIMDLIIRALANTQREPRYAYIAPTYTQAKDVAWAYLKEYTAAIPGIEKSESELFVTLPTNGARIRLYGADNYDRLRGLYHDGVVIDEAGDHDPRAWPEVIRPTLSDRKGWATFIGTPKGDNDFHAIFERSRSEDDWFSGELKASVTKLIDDEELADARRTLTPEQYAQEYECSFNAAVLGAYYGRDMELAESEERITRVPHDRAADTYASWDLGIGDSTAIWIFQIVGKEWHWLKYYENSSQRLDHYVDWIKSLPFAVHKHFLPHDAEARELQTGNSRVEFLTQRGLNCEVVPRHNVDDRINAARVKFNRFFFDKQGCEAGIKALRMYRAEYDDKHKTLKPRPLHDWASHGADAFGGGVMGGEEKRMKPVTPKRNMSWVV
jgi:phage terminase large subunit